MTLPVPSVPNPGLRITRLEGGWTLAGTPPGACASPAEAFDSIAAWADARVPGTVASSLHKDIDAAGPYDAQDWWYRTTFADPGVPSSGRCRLRFEGLATIATVWLNGTVVLESQNMFLAHEVDVTGHVRAQNELAIVFRSLDAVLAARRPRPRWKTALVEQQNLRWVRTTLLGRIPGWTPPIAPVGPWAPISIECVDGIDLRSTHITASVEGTTGRIMFRTGVVVPAGQSLGGARLRVAGQAHALEVEGGEVRGMIEIPGVPLWWPHTHGTPALHACALELLADGEWRSFDCGSVAFRKIGVDQADGRFRLQVNGLPVFCRGACWTTTDILALRAGPERLRAILELARDAGANMLRVGGTMVYESDDFYRLCDELGILVWQDFMFANMDYPVADAAFRASIEAEARQQLGRLQRHACVAVYCGGSEIAQQAAMLGLSQEHWSNDFFSETLPALCAEWHPGVPYVPSSPWGGALPFHVANGVSHYYGVGAYRRPIADARAARVRFTSECLGFSNVPDPETIDLMLGGRTPPPHHPRWKARQPRDSGAGWDFEDVRDHYFRLLFDADPVQVRSRDVEGYYARSRVVSGEVMQRVFSEWRSPASECGGGLVWFLMDLWPGAGWGIIDSTGRPKAAYWHLRRAWAPQALRITDEGLDGLHLHLLNEGAAALDVTVELELLHAGRTATERASAARQVPARGALTVGVDAMLGVFSDSAGAYRFGPARHDVVVARMLCASSGEVLGEDFFFPCGLGLEMQRNAVIAKAAAWQPDGTVHVTLQSDAFLQSVSVACADFSPGDNYFHLSPGRTKVLVFRPRGRPAARFKAEFGALNLPGSFAVRAQREAPQGASGPAPAP